MLYLESPSQVTSLSTKFMHERGGVPQLDKYQYLLQLYSKKLTIVLTPFTGTLCMD